MASNTEVAQKRILYVITKATWGGAQRYVFDLAQAAKGAGHEVLVVAGTEGALTTRLMEAGIATNTIASMERDIKLLAELRSFATLLKIVRDFRPTVVHGNSSKAGLLAAFAARLTGIPSIIFTAHGWAFNEGRPAWQKTIIAFLHYATVLLAHRTICVSRALRQDADWMPLVGKRLFVIHNGVTNVTFLPRNEARTRLAPTLAHAYPHAFWFGTIAELHPTKGLDTLIEAFAKVTQDLPNAVLVLIGEGQEWARLQKLVQIYDLADRVVLAGFIADASTYLKAFDAFVLPSRSEALGYALLEAGLASLPAIGTRVGGIPEVLEDDVSGMLVPAKDSAALATALTTLASDTELQNRLGTALHENVVSEFNTETMCDKTLALY